MSRRGLILIAVLIALLYGLVGGAEMREQIAAGEERRAKVSMPLECDATVIQSLPSGRNPTYACYARRPK